MMKVFDIDYKRLIVLLLPTGLRKPILFAFLKSMTRPIVILYDDFNVQRTKNLYKANHNCQVCYLRKMLNDLFDNESRRIQISDGSSNNWTFVFKQETFNDIEDGIPLWVGRADSIISDSFGNSTLDFNNDNTGVRLISKQGYIGSSGLDFLVRVPVELRGLADENRMVSLINDYKLVSKRYAIIYF